MLSSTTKAFPDPVCVILTKSEEVFELNQLVPEFPLTTKSPSTYIPPTKLVSPVTDKAYPEGKEEPLIAKSPKTVSPVLNILSQPICLTSDGEGDPDVYNEYNLASAVLRAISPNVKPLRGGIFPIILDLFNKRVFCLFAIYMT